MGSGSESTSDDDLEITKTLRWQPPIDGADELSNGLIQSGSRERWTSKRSRQKRPHWDGERVEWSEGENAGEAVYDDFRNRRAEKRKKAAAVTRKVKAATAAGPAMVGRRTKGRPSGLLQSGAASRREGAYRHFDSEEDLMETTLPDFLKGRKERHDEKRKRLGDAGLKLPPDYSGVELSDDERLESLKEKPLFKGIKPCAAYKDVSLPYSLGVIPAPIAQWLRDYQVEGAAFLHELFVYQKGGILGDDMGLGKTVQVIAFLTAAFGKTGDERDAKRLRKMRRAADQPWYPKVLVICPGGLMENWKNEFQRWGWWHVDVYHGPRTNKEAMLQAAANGRVEIVVTTYRTYTINRGAINMIEWDCVVADECHTIKERQSEVTQAMNEVNALCRIGLTGTAIQNKYEELWTLLNWTNPGRFGPVSAWKSSISEPLKIGQSHDATVPQLAKARRTAQKLVQNLLPEFFLRRMKTLIADQLPKKSDRVVFCPLTETQAEAYQNYVDSDVCRYIRSSTDLCPCGSTKQRGWCCYTKLPSSDTSWQNHVFPAISVLQNLANHLAILIPQGMDPQEKQSRDLENLQIALPGDWRQLYNTRDNIMNFANQEFCGKWRVLKKLLRFWHTGGDRVLVFSHSVRLLKMLQTLFTSTTSYTVSYLDGSLSYSDRAKVVDDFNSSSDSFVFLISTKAGGVGLNITAANKVVIVDPNWNPSYDLQAQDRAYRIGQVRDVEVFRLVSAGTIEEIVYARQIYKQQQANIGYNASEERRYFKGVQDRKDQKGEIFGLSNMFKYQGSNLLLRDIVNQTNVAESKAGVSVVGYRGPKLGDQDDEVDAFGDGEAGNETLSQLAGLVKSEEAGLKHKMEKQGRKKADPILSILAQAGVEYSHENSEVIGTSKVESRLSRQAIEASSGADVQSARVFQGSQSEQGGARNPRGEYAFEGSYDIRYRYRPPAAVQRRQFCTMAQMWDFEDVVEFALVVEGWTQLQRRDALDKFYADRRAKLTSKA